MSMSLFRRLVNRSDLWKMACEGERGSKGGGGGEPGGPSESSMFRRRAQGGQGTRWDLIAAQRHGCTPWEAARRRE